ncbi:UDP-glucose 6-dehydrogenase [Saccharopolyspora sp. 5N102]|uniref:UDP-glucose 6-dehydrogenase n=1 Tax=Saccharopolyspora sp. 5N102 TaxID=3375155 RepID=UPI0037B62EC2
MAATDRQSTRVEVLGTGRTAAVVAAGLARLGHRVRCRQPDSALLHTETGLLGTILQTTRSGRLSFAPGAGADLVVVCGAGEDELAAVEPELRPGRVVVNAGLGPWESTPDLAEFLGRTGVAVVSNPQCLREGAELDDFLTPGCIVVGAGSAAAAREVEALYTDVDAPVLHVDVRSADLIAPVGNGFCAVEQCFVAELTRLCSRVGADPCSVLECLRADQRVGHAGTARMSAEQRRSLERLLELARPDPPAMLRALAEQF